MPERQDLKSDRSGTEGRRSTTGRELFFTDTLHPLAIFTGQGYQLVGNSRCVLRLTYGLIQLYAYLNAVKINPYFSLMYGSRIFIS